MWYEARNMIELEKMYHLTDIPEMPPPPLPFMVQSQFMHINQYEHI